MYNQPPAAPQPKKRNPWLLGCLGCGGAAVLLFVVVGIVAVAMSGDTTTAPSSGTGQAAGGGAATDEAGETGGAEQAAQEEPAEQGPIKLEAKAAEFTPSLLAQGGDYTSVQVTVTNTGEEKVEVNPLYFAITGTDGTKRDTADGLGMDKNQIDTVTLAPGENATGVVTAKGSFEPAAVTFTSGLLGEPVRAEVK